MDYTCSGTPVTPMGTIILLRSVPMPWKVETVMSQRKEFVTLAQADGMNMRELRRRFGISRKTGYKWLRRYRAGGCWRCRTARHDHGGRPVAPAPRSSTSLSRCGSSILPREATCSPGCSKTVATAVCRPSARSPRPPAPGTDRPRGERPAPALPALRARPAERSVADGLQGRAISPSAAVVAVIP